MASISPDEKVFFNVDHPLRTEIDKVSDANFTYVARSLDPKRATTEAGWQVYRITNADGTLKFAQAPAGVISSTGVPLPVGKPSDDFVFTASEAANYTY